MPKLHVSRKPEQLPQAVYEYMNPIKRVAYYFGAAPKDEGKRGLSGP